MSNEREAGNGKSKRSEYNIPEDNGELRKIFKSIYKMMNLTIRGQNRTKLFLTDNDSDGMLLYHDVRMMAKSFGMNLIIIEGPRGIIVPDITQISYTVIRGDQEEGGVLQESDITIYPTSDTESALVTKLKDLTPIDNATYFKMLKSNKRAKDIYKEYSNFINKVRAQTGEKNKFKTMLFIDDYYAMLKGGNALRGFLNALLTESTFRNYDISKETFIMGALINCDEHPPIPPSHELTLTTVKTTNESFFLSMADKYLPTEDDDDDEWLRNKLLKNEIDN